MVRISRWACFALITGSVLLALVVGLGPDEPTKLQQFRELEQQ